MALPFKVSWPPDGAGPASGPACYRRPAGSSERCELTIQLPTGAAAGVRLVSSARTVEVYSCLPGQEASYVCSLRGTQQAAHATEAAAEVEAAAGHGRAAAGTAAAAAAPAGWRVEHRWAAHAAPPALLLRLLSLAERDTLHLHSLQLIPPEGSNPDGGGHAAHAASGLASGSLAEAGSPEAPCTAAAAGRAAAAAAAAGGSQLEGVHALLARLAAEEPGGGAASGGSGGAVADPRRALMAGIANSVLRQAAAQQQAAIQQQAATSPTGWSPPVQHQPSPAAPPAAQQQQQEGGTAAALQRLEERVAALESLCGEMHGMLGQLLARAGAPTPALPPPPFLAGPP